MAIKSINITTSENVAKVDTTDWTTGSSNSRTSIQDKISPILTVTNSDSTGVDANSDISSKVSAKIDGNGVTSINSMKDTLGISSLSLPSEVTGTLKSNMVNSITNKLTSPCVPLGTKGALSKAMDVICSKSGMGQMSLNLSLTDLLNGFSLDALLDLIKCLSDPAALGGSLLSMINSSLPTNTIASGLKSSLSSVTDLSVVKSIGGSANGNKIINNNTSILDMVNKNTSGSTDMSKADTDNLYDMLPSAESRMDVYGECKDGLYNTLLDNKNNNKSKESLAMTPPPIDEFSLGKLRINDYTTNEGISIVT